MPHAYIPTDVRWRLGALIIHILFTGVFFFFFFFDWAGIDWLWHWLLEKLLFVLHWGLLTAETLHHHHAYNVNIMSTWSCIILKEIFTVEPGNGESTHNFNGKPFIQPLWGYKHFNFFVFAFQNEIYPILITSYWQNVVNSSLLSYCKNFVFGKLLHAEHRSIFNSPVIPGLMNE